MVGVFPLLYLSALLVQSTHLTPIPHSAELLFVVDGSLEVGFIDSTNKLYTQRLQLGDMFVFPKGLVHYQSNANANAKNPATAISAFGNANAGTVSVPSTVFATGIDDNILAKLILLLSRRSKQVSP